MEGRAIKPTLWYDVLLVQQHYAPLAGHVGERKYICIDYTTDRRAALKSMHKYVAKTHGFVTPDRQFAVKDVILRARALKGNVLSETSYCDLFDPVTDKLRAPSGAQEEAAEIEGLPHA